MSEEKTNLKVSEMLGLQENPVDKDIEVGDAIESAIDFDFEKMYRDQEESMQKKEVKPEKRQIKKVDLSKLNIVSTNELEKEKILRNALFGQSSVYQVVAAQSGYLAKVRPLVNKDGLNILSSNLSRYEYRKLMFKVIYDKIVAFSCGPMSFEEWLKNTSIEDVETFYYGIYCVTFPKQGSFTYTCPQCKEEHTITIGNNTLVKTSDNEKMRNHIREVSKNANSREAMEKYSLIKTSDAYELSDSGIVAEIRTPTLWDFLEILRTVPEAVIDRNASSVTDMLYIKRFLIPTNDSYAEQTDS